MENFPSFIYKSTININTPNEIGKVIKLTSIKILFFLALINPIDCKIINAFNIDTHIKVVERYSKLGLLFKMLKIN